VCFYSTRSVQRHCVCGCATSLTQSNTRPSRTVAVGSAATATDAGAFFLSRDCKLYLLSWFIYDSQQGKPLSESEVRQQFPQLDKLPVRHCPFKASPSQIEQALHIKLPPEPGLVLIYMDFNYERDSLKIILKPEHIAMHQQRLDTLSQLKTIPK